MNSSCYLHSPPTMTARANKLQLPSTGTDRSAMQAKDSDKPIPFLRRLIDMLQENEAIISFHPGTRKKNCQHTPGRIVVHDRAKVESDILPRYFNHASFASLRRQLNYFAFSRVGKGKQKGATYCNENVVDILDILRLKRRVVGSAIPVVQGKKFEGTVEETPKEHIEHKKPPGSPSSSHVVSLESIPSNKTTAKIKINKKRKKPSKNSKKIINSVVPVVHLPKKVKSDMFPLWDTFTSEIPVTSKKGPLVLVSPSPSGIPMAPQISLDLTQPPAVTTSSSSTPYSQVATSTNSCSNSLNDYHIKEADVLAGCSALLALGCQSSI